MYVTLQGYVTGVSCLLWHITESFLEEVMFGLWPKGCVGVQQQNQTSFPSRDDSRCIWSSESERVKSGGRG